MLKAFLASLPDEITRKAWAASCGTSVGHLRNCIYAAKPIAPETCVLIERNSASRVRRWHLRPSDWFRIWPELLDAEGAPIVDPGRPPVAFAGWGESRQRTPAG